MNNRFASRTPAIIALAASLPTLCLAQATMSRVTITHVKPDMLSEWVDLQKNEVVPALKKAGIKTRTVYSTGLFGNSYEYVQIQPLEKFADFDAGNPLTKVLGQPAASRLGEKLRKCTLSQNSFQSTRLADLSNPSDTPPQIIVSTRVRIAPGRMQDFQNVIKSDVLPVYKKLKVTYTVNRRGLGTNSNDVTLSTGYSKYADLDGGSPLVRALGQDGAAKVLGKLTGIATLIEQVVRSRVADLSF